MRIESDQPQPDRSRQAVSQVVRARVRGRHVGERVGELRELALPDEMQSKLSSTATSLRIRDEDVDLRILTITHVVNEGDFRPHEIEIAEPAIEKDAQLDRRL